MSKIDDGGPAFPHPVNKHDVGIQLKIVDGMTLRDFFAAAALTGMCADGAADYETSRLVECDGGERTAQYGRLVGPNDIASRAYCIADAMIAQRPDVAIDPGDEV